jgi:hypothetical protein
MIALRQNYQPQAQQRGNGNSRPRQQGLQLRRLSGSIASQERELHNIATCFRDQAAMLPLQCSASVERLDALRVVACRVSLYLSNLHPAATQRLRPYASIELLATLDYQLSEIMLCIAMLEPICQATSYERIALHLYIRSKFPRVLDTFEGCLSQLAALNDPDRSGSQEAAR